MDNLTFENDFGSHSISTSEESNSNSNNHKPQYVQYPPSESTSSESDHEKVGLKRSVGLVSAIGLIVGVMIGSGIFVSPGGLFHKSGSVGLSLLIWFGCGVLSMFGAIAYIELGTVVPASGGEYIYLLEAFGPVFGFLFSWISTLILKPCGMAIMCLSFAQYSINPILPLVILEGLPPGSEYIRWTQNLICSATIMLITYINSVSVDLATKVQNIFTIAKLIAVAIIIATGIYNISVGELGLLATGFDGSRWEYGVLASAFYNGLWAYDGWNNLNYITEELKNPYKNLPLAILIGLPLVAICFILVNVAYFTVVTADEIIHQPVAIIFGKRALGVLSFLMPLSVCLSTFSAANGSQFTAGRLCYAASRGGHLVEVLSYIDIKRNTPSLAMMFNAIISISMTLFLDIEGLIDSFSFAAWIFYGLTVASLIRLRYTKPDAPRPFKVPLIIPILVVIISAFLVIAPIINEPKEEYLLTVGFLSFGLIIYVPFCHFKLVLPGMKKLTQILQFIFQAAPPDCDPNLIPPPESDNTSTTMVESED